MPLQFTPVKLNAQQRKKAEKAGIAIESMAEADKYYGGPELGFLSLEYLLCSNVFLLSRYYHLFGDEKNGKSTILFDWLNRYFLEPGGSATLVETENKLNVDLVKRMLGENYSNLDQARVTVLEDAQKAMTLVANAAQALTKKKNMVLFGIGLDSFRVPAKATVDQVKTEGNSARNYAIEAGLWRPYLGTFMNLIQDMPVALIVVNHARDEAVEGTGIKKKGVGGGTMLKYLESYRILVQTIKRIELTNSSRSVLSLKTTTNSNGPMNRKIFPEIVYRDPEMEDRVYIDWYAADAALLTGDGIPRTKLAKEDVCDTKASSEKGLYSDSVLGLTKVPIQEITQAIYSDPERLARFRELNQISVHKSLEQLAEQGWFFDAKGAKKVVEDDDDED